MLEKTNTVKAFEIKQLNIQMDANKSRCVLNYYEELSAGSKTDIVT